jgi:hypothetical protein
MKKILLLLLPLLSCTENKTDNNSKFIENTNKGTSIPFNIYDKPICATWCNGNTFLLIKDTVTNSIMLKTNVKKSIKIINATWTNTGFKILFKDTVSNKMYLTESNNWNILENQKIIYNSKK